MDIAWAVDQVESPFVKFLLVKYMSDSTSPYNPRSAEKQTQQYWEDNGSFEVSENDPRPKFYCLAMFPYPSGQLHMGHVRTYTLGDVIARFQRLQGKNVLHPMGWDAFGLPAENAAIKHKVPPAKWTMSNIDHMKTQLKSLGFSYDWSRELYTCDPEYYRWEQWFFTRMFAKGLVYKKAAFVNWDPVDQTVLANEQVIDGRGWRSNALVERKELAQWFLKITDYAEELLDKLNDLDGWPEKIKTMQRNWIGKSEGLEFTFPFEEAGLDSGISVYTTRPDTLMGATYIAVASQHPIAKAAAKNNVRLAEFLDQCSKVKVAEADMAKMEKLGMNTGYSAKHPITGEQIPVWVANFVLMEYGSGAVMAVPAHDQRDYEFAQKYGLSIKQVVTPKAGSDEECNVEVGAYVSKQGTLINSEQFDGLSFKEAFKAVSHLLAEQGLGERQTKYRLRDWGVSRQRYWGCPIPIINCDGCGPVAVPDADLPVELPTDIEFEGIGSPIKNMPQWYETTCPNCGGDATRETDTFDTFMESSWYYARFASSKQDEAMLDDRAKYWTSVDHYVGGEEHAILHLLYARFFHKVMRDEGLVESDEPFTKLLSLGMVLKDGVKMSKSAGAAGDPQHLIDLHGADAVRMAMMFAAPPEQSFEWSENGVESSARWLRTRLWDSVMRCLEYSDERPVDTSKLDDKQKELRRLVHEIIKKAEDDYGRRLRFNTVISSVMTLMNHIDKFDAKSPIDWQIVREGLTTIVLVMSPITPHICRDLWHKLSRMNIEDARWLEVDEAALALTSVEMIVQVNGKLRGKFQISPETARDEIENIAKNVDNVGKFMDGKTLRKVIVVPNKLVNFVVS
jgi:leucyl-tRNA synthetase